jgi:hypothetical protein
MPAAGYRCDGLNIIIDAVGEGDEMVGANSSRARWELSTLIV